MEIISSVVNKVFQFTRLSSENNVRRSKKMEEKALEVYGEWWVNRLTGKQCLANYPGSVGSLHCFMFGDFILTT